MFKKTSVLKYKKHLRMVLWVCLVNFLCISHSVAQSSDANLVSINFPELTDIQDIIKAVGLWTGKQVLIDSNVKGKVQILAPKKVRPEEAYQIFLSALDSIELTTVETGKLIKILKKKSAVKEALKINRDSLSFPHSDEMVTQVFYLKFIEAEPFRVSIARLIPATFIIAHKDTNSIIVSDTGHNLKKVARAIEIMDVQTNQPGLYQFALQHADASEVEKQLKDMSSLKRGEGKQHALSAYKFIIDRQQNILFAYGPRTSISMLRKIVASLDRSVDEVEHSIYNVRPILFGDAKSLAQILTQLRASGSSSVGLPEELRILADESTNSLIVIGSRNGFEAVNRILAKLDRQKSQVFFAVDVLEVSDNSAFRQATSIIGGYGQESGKGEKYVVGWEGARSAPMVLAASSASTGQINAQSASQVASVFAEELTVSLVPGKTVNVPGMGEIAPQALLKLIKADSGTKVISSPMLLTIENEEAHVSIGETVYFNSSQNSEAGIPIPKVEKENVDLTMTITPKVSNQSNVDVKLEIESQDVIGMSEGGIPRLAKKKSSQSLIAKNGQTVVVSGLTKEFRSFAQKKVPLLGDIPILGWLFRTQNVEMQSSRLMILITPHVIHGQDDLVAVYKNILSEKLSKLALPIAHELEQRKVIKQ